MKLPFQQIQSTFCNVVLIIIVIALGTVSSAFLEGGIHGWGDIAKALNHGLAFGVCVAFGWVAMKSPIGDQVRTLLGTTTITEPSGKTTETTIAVTEPVAVTDEKKP